jgi:L-threonylcarbamoyladenylate synthase
MLILPDSAEARRRAAQAVAEGGVIAFRTDTFYGLGADPFNREALRSLHSLKGRAGRKPILIVISDEREAERFVASKPPFFDRLRGNHWPGALTLVVAARTDVPGELTAGTGTVGVRLPDDEEVRVFVRACGGALTATSANLAGESPAQTAEDVARSFPEGLSLIVDGGETRAERPSTVLDVSGPVPRMIREGVVSRSELRRTFQEIGLELQ